MVTFSTLSLLIVAEQKNASFFLNHSEDYEVDFVKYFPPDESVTDKKYRNNGWTRIFDKISTTKPKNAAKNKKYKFDNIPKADKIFYNIKTFFKGELCKKI